MHHPLSENIELLHATLRLYDPHLRTGTRTANLNAICSIFRQQCSSKHHPTTTTIVIERQRVDNAS